MSERTQNAAGQEETQSKTCIKCGEEKPRDGFYGRKSARDRLTAECKKCANRRSAALYAINRNDPEYMARRRVLARPVQKKYREANREQRQDSLAAWRAANKDRISEQYRLWRLANAERVNEKNQRRRARLMDQFVAPVDRNEIWDRDQGCCQICGDPIERGLPWPHPLSKTLDHIKPLVKGGTHEPANVQLAHAVCNSRKNDRILEPTATDIEAVLARDWDQLVLWDT